MDNDRNWRFRLELCNQVKSEENPLLIKIFSYGFDLIMNIYALKVAALVPLCSSEEVLAHLAPLCLLLVNDRVSEVMMGCFQSHKL